MEGYGHPLYSTGRKATRVSHSTSHGESLAMLDGIQVAQLIASRNSEPFFSHYVCPRIPTPMDCLTTQNLNLVLVPIDCLTDCMDVFELVCSAKGLSNDETQRLVILGLRELRRYGLFRALIHVPTSVMLADGITKVGKIANLLRFGSTGYVRWGDLGDKCFRISALPARAFAPQEDLEAVLPDQLTESLHAPLHVLE